MRVVFIDSLNSLFIRNYVVNPTLSLNGAPIGGVVGGLKSLQSMINYIKPDEVVVVWDGLGGSRRRRAIDKNYKAGRKPINLNRSLQIDPQDEERNKFWQHAKLIEYLSFLPVKQLIYESVEADDVIAFLVHREKYKEAQKIIVSSDKDFFQLIDKNTIVYRPIQDEVLSIKKILEKYGIHPRNFALARAISGDDKSDNVQGVGGVKLKSVAKRFDFLKEEKEYSIDDVVKFCQNVEKPLVIHKNILSGRDQVIQNMRMIQLDSPLISLQAQGEIREEIEKRDLVFRKSMFTQSAIKDGFAELNWTPLFQWSNRVMSEIK